MGIHPTAIVDSAAKIDASADIGPGVVIDGPVQVGPNTRVYPHAYLSGWTKIGAGCEIHPGAVVGHLPQDLAYDGGESYCTIGDGTIIREGATIHRGTKPGSATVIGERCFIMCGAHVAHNCHLGHEVKMTTGSMLGGYAQVGNGAFLGGNAGVHQFVRIGELAMVGGAAKITQDVPPYFLVGDLNSCTGTNLVGMRRAGFTREQVREVKKAFAIVYRSGLSLARAVEELADSVTTEPGQRILAFLREASRRGIVHGRRQEGLTPDAAKSHDDDS